MPTENMNRFVEKVAAMREAQSRYFESRDHFDLRLAIEREKEVDRMIREFRMRHSQAWL